MSREPRWHIVLPSTQIGLLGLLAWRAWPWDVWRWPVLAVGGALALWAVLGLGASLTPMPAPNGRGLKTVGPYRWIRHPVYAGLIVASLGLAPGSWLGWAAWAALSGVLVAKVRLEEELLRGAYPEFAAYARRSWRLVPFVW